MIAKAQIAKLQQWMKDEIEKTAGSRQYYENQLKEYIAMRKAEDHKYVLRTPVGSVTLVKPAPKWVYDDDALMGQLRDNMMTDCIRTKEEIDKAKLKKACQVTEKGEVVTADGVVLEDVTLEEQEPRLQIHKNTKEDSSAGKMAA